MPVVFDSAAAYVESCKTLKDKIAAIDAIIDALETTALKAASTGNITSYSLDDGQTRINTVYRNAAEVEASISAFEKIKQRYINRLNGHRTRLVDSKNFNR